MLQRSPSQVVRFGMFELDLQSGDLWKAGRRIRLQNQPRQVLRILVSHRGHLVTRDELRRELWPDHTFVDFDNGLNVAIRKIRDALGDVAPSPRFIETERARGYRFIAPVGEDMPAPDTQPVTVEPQTESDVVPQQPPLAARWKSKLTVVAIGAATLCFAGMLIWYQGADDDERRHTYELSTNSGPAYEHYLMGRSRLRSLTEDSALQAIAEFRRAIDLDPQYARAHAGIASAAAQLRIRFASHEAADVWDRLARTEAARALQLDPDLSEAHVALAAVHRFQEYDWDTVIREGRRALELNPSLDVPHLYLGAAYFHIGLLDEAEAAVNAARELNPENRVEAWEILGAINLFAGRTKEAVAHLSRAHDVSDSRIVKYLLAWTLYYSGEQRRAEQMLETMVDDDGAVAGNARATLAAILAARGATSDARSLAERVAAEPDLIHHAAYGLGTAYAQLGDQDAALRWLSRAATSGFSCYPWFERDPLLDPIRHDSRFQLFMGELRRSWERNRFRYRG